MALPDYIPTGPHQNQPPANNNSHHHPSDHWHDQLFHLHRHFSIHIQRGSGEAPAPFLNQTQVGNYRLVSLPPLLSKITERAVLKQITKFLSRNLYLDPIQSWFKRKFSTEMTLVSMIETFKTAQASAQSLFLFCLTNKQHVIQSTIVSFSLIFLKEHHRQFSDLNLNYLR